MNKVFYHAAWAVGLLAMSPAGAAAIVNGSFEIGTDPGATFSSQTAGSSAITGWTVGGFGVDYIGGYWQASDGVRSIDLSYLSAGSVSQAIDTVIGQVYTVNFDLSGNPDGGTGGKISVVSISGSLPDIKTYVVGPSNSLSQMNWETFTYTFTAFATSSLLTFASDEYGPYGPALDNVSILSDGGTGSTVPEPANWALMVAGFGMIGFASRRRSALRRVIC